MHADAVVLDAPHEIRLRTLALGAPGSADVVVATRWSGISTGTERRLWSGTMPPFPGLRFPLVPGYETVGVVVEAGAEAGRRVGETVFVPGARCFADAACLFGGAASALVTQGARVAPVDAALGADAVLLALAATATHAVAGGLPDLVVGHGVLGRLVARIGTAAGAPPTVWETNAARRDGGHGYAVVAPDDDPRRDYRTILDVSGDGEILDALVARLAPGGEIVLGGFYDRLSFAFPPAFMKEARIRIAAEWRPADLDAARAAIADGRLDLTGLVTHRAPARDAAAAYRTAFAEPDCRKMVLDWEGTA